MKGLRVVVIGGTAGMGLAIAEAALQKGANVVVASRSQDRLEAALHKLGRGAEGRTLDVGEDAAVAGFFDDIGQCDHVVVTANAASAVLGIAKPLKDLDPAAAAAFFRTKFWGSFHVGRHAPAHLNAGGSLVYFSGAAARRSLPGHTAIAATNGAVEAFAKQLAKEIAPIRVNVISPGLVDTPAYDAMPQANRQAMYDNAAKALPVGRIGTVEDVADATLFVLGNGYLSGAVLDVDGGRQVQ